MNNISYIEPLAKAWRRMVALLFMPFDATKWLVIGFAAWLATLDQGGIPTLRISRAWSGPCEDGELTRAINDFISEHWMPFMTLAGIAILLGAAVILLLLWVNSRAKLIFFDNVVRNRAGVLAPWQRFRARGDSLFLWRLGFAIVCIVLILCAGLIAVVITIPFASTTQYTPFALLGIAVGVSLTFALSLAAGYAILFLNDFVIPLMHKLNLKTTRAWDHFLLLFKAHFWTFMFYGLFRFLLSMIVTAALIFVMIGACCFCCAGVLLVIPYVSSVVLLPISSFFRFYGPAFLAQFGPQYDCLTEPPEPGTRSAAHRFAN